MFFASSRKNLFACSMILAGLITFLSCIKNSATLAQDNAVYIDQARTIETRYLGILDPAGLSFSSKAGIFLIVDHSKLAQSSSDLSSDITIITPTEDLVGSVRIADYIHDPINMTFDKKASRLLIFQSDTNTLVEIKAGSDGYLDPDTITKFDAQKFGLQNPQGMTVDPVHGHLFILDSAVPEIVHIRPHPLRGFHNAKISRIHLEQIEKSDLRGIALNPVNGHLSILNFYERMLYEFTRKGKLVARRDVSEFGLQDPQGMVFAPSGDLTDDPSQTSLYIANCSLTGKGVQKTQSSDDRGKKEEQGYGNIIELSLTQPPVVAATSNATLVRTIDTSRFSPPSPDPSGITYLPSSNRLLMCDGEVEEMSIFAGANLFETSLTGNLLDTLSTMPFSDEPTGITINPANRHLFISDDVERKVFELNPGPDGKYDTSDDRLTSFDTRPFGSTDPEGIAYDTSQGVLFIADGLNREVYRVAPGNNSVFDGISPSGDDQVTHFDTLSIGVDDPEGIEYNPDNNRLYLVGKPATQLAELTKTGALTQMFDISAANAKKPAGLAFAPGSLNANVRNIYIAARGVDNDSNPNENDGKVYEMSFTQTPPGNQRPTVSAGADQTITLPANASLNGTVSDDGLPNPPGAVTTTWSKVSGSGTVTFGNANAVDTTASFSAAGTYVLRLTANDSELNTGDDVTITVLDTTGGGTIDVRVSIGTDDAEESASGDMLLGSSDLEMVSTSSGNQKVGMRFTGINIPKDAAISNAYIQFKADEIHSDATSLIIQGEAANNAAAFTSVDGNMSSRPRTTAAVSWSPAAWLIKKEVGLNQRTPNISSVIQEIVSRAGWSSGNSLVIIITGTGRRVAKSYNGDQAGAPLLHVVYSTGGQTNQPPLVNAGQDQAVTLPASAALDGSVSDDGLPNPPGAVTTTWSKVSGPGTVTFGNANAIDTTASFSVAGTYVLRLTANDGGLNASDELSVIVSNTISNQPPTVNAGVDQSITLPDIATLDGTVTDDGLPNPPGTVTTTWSKVSGPGTVTFGNANAIDTTASFSAAGTYVLRLTANDSELNTGDDVTITVLDTTGGGTIDVRVSIGTDDAEESASGDMLLGSSDLEMVSTSSGNQKVGMRFTGINIPKDAAISNAYIQFKADEIHSDATSLIIQGEAANNAAAFTSVDGNMSSRPRTTAAVSWSPAAWLIKKEVGLNQRTPNISSVIQEIVSRAGWSSGNSLVIIITGTGRRVAKSYNGDQAGAPLLHVVYSTGGQTNQPPLVNAGQDQAVTLPASAALDGSVSDDGLPNPPGAVTTTWSKVSGPGTVTFGNANAIDTTASFSEAGTYVLSLTADDGELSPSDEITIVVSNPIVNQPPTVDAGADQSITFPDSTILDGTVTDDGLPTGTVTTTWSVVSGTGTVTFADTSAVDTTASFSEAGMYVLSLTADDGELSPSDEITIEVIQPIINQPPTVDAGVEQLTVTLPDSATLDGTVTDDGLPTGTITTTWSVVSGTGTVSFGDANAVDTTASFSEAGTYVLSLTADDGELSPSDEITIVVSNPIVNQPPTVNAGADQSITLPNTAILDGTVSDDGLPNPPGTVTTIWSMVSGPGTVTFGEANAVDTTASFSAAGSYVLKLTADDNELNTSAEVSITVSD
ncbi:MAG: hypothetical protein QY317_14685 [Candidatus Jettenia caeni]|nr:MAG: hypothetical protein QY317_14685 [Candidatus Jettenia caeni]